MACSWWCGAQADQSVVAPSGASMAQTARNQAHVRRRPKFRGQGIARRLLAALEAESTALGISRLVLETGARQPEALEALYEARRICRIPAFGEYVEIRRSVSVWRSNLQSLKT